METRSRKKKIAPDKNNDSKNECLMKQQNKEDRLRSLLGPLDKYISCLECILVWDYPIVFIILLVFINVLFWLYTITPFYCLLSFCLLVCLCIQVISNHLWPFINDSEDSLDGWVKLQAQNEDGFDLVRSTAHLLSTLDTAYTSCEQVKRNNPQKFHVLGLILFLFILIISFFLNDFYFVYISVMLLLCWPGCQHNQLPERLLNIIRPHLASLEKTLHIRRTVNKRRLRRKVSKKVSKLEQQLRLDQLVLSEDDSDLDIQQFLPAHHDNLENDLFPFFPSDKRPGVYDDDDDDETAREYLPHVTALSDSRDNSDDDEFLPDMGNFSLNDHSFNSRNDPPQQGSSEADKRDPSPRKDAKNKRMKEEGTKERDVKVTEGKAVGKKENVGVSEEMLAEGLSFDDEDDIDATNQPTLLNNKLIFPIAAPLSLIGGLLGQAASNDIEKSAKTNGIFSRALGGFNLLKNVVTAVYTPAGMKGKKEAVVVDHEFDFLQQEDLDDVEDF